VAEGADVEAADVGLKDLERRHLSELHELAAAAGIPRYRTLRRAQLAAAINAALGSETTPTETPLDSQAEQHVFAIIRLERGSRWTPAPKPDQVGVEKIVSSEAEAEREAERLNAQSGQSGTTYFWRAAPLEPAND
jgi:Rho termination factor-like protein